MCRLCTNAGSEISVFRVLEVRGTSQCMVYFFKNTLQLLSSNTAKKIKMRICLLLSMLLFERGTWLTANRSADQKARTESPLEYYQSHSPPPKRQAQSELPPSNARSVSDPTACTCTAFSIQKSTGACEGLVFGKLR